MDYSSTVTILSNSMGSTNDFLLIFFSGVGATLLGVLLTSFLEGLKTNKQERIIVSLLRQELINNKIILEGNLMTINQELGIMEQGKMVVEPLKLLNSEFINLLLINLPRIFRKNETLLGRIYLLSRLAKINNGLIDSREMYRINNSAMDNFNNRMKIYDNILHDRTTQLINNINVFLEEPLN